MNKKNLLFTVALVFISAGELFAQFSQPDGSPVAGFEFRPIIPSELFRTGPISSNVSGANFTISQQFGFDAGMIVDTRVFKNLGFEAGISFTQRNFALTINEGDFNSTSSFRIIGYEVPFSALVTIPLSESFRMNNALGITLDAFPSNIATTGNGYYQEAIRVHTIIPALTANTGIKYITYNWGAIYLGASYHLPFSNIYYNKAIYEGDASMPTLYSQLRGNYFTADIKYFFPYHKVPVKKKKKKNKFGGTNSG